MQSTGRKIDYPRISVTDRCNEHCVYCMPEGYKGWERREEHLSAVEIIRIVRVAADLGFKKFRLTGGEPLLRNDLLEIAREIKKIPGVEHLMLSTNGIKLAALAQPLREAGVQGINVSLDALEPAIYKRITGGDIARVIEGIDAALAAGFQRVKLNCVLMRGVNETELWPLVLFATKHGLPLRFIELMPLTRADVLTEKNFYPTGAAMKLLSQRDKLVPQPDVRMGHGPAKYFRLEQTGASIGFIGAMTGEHFCEACNKIRITADGKIRPCLGDHGEIDLRAGLRETNDDSKLRRIFAEAMLIKPIEHQFRNSYRPSRPMTAIGG